MSNTIQSVLNAVSGRAKSAACRFSLSTPISVTRVTSDSREVVPGTVFVAVKGLKSDGHRFIRSVVEAGAQLVIGEESAENWADIPYLEVTDSRVALAQAAAAFYGDPSHRLRMIGITGTSGKTTTTYLCEAILQAAGERVGVIGTVNIRIGNTIFHATHTTPGPVELQRILAEMRDAGCQTVVMEVSSHALIQHRTTGVAFDVMVFTNLSPEHLDFHADLEDYFQAKSILFKREYVSVAVRAGKRPIAVINEDSEYGRRLIEMVRTETSELSCIGFGMNAEAEFSGVDLRLSLEGIEGRFRGEPVMLRLPGRFNAENLLAALGATHALGIMMSQALRALREIEHVPGRLERVDHPGGVTVLVDYAHKSDALEKVLQTLRNVQNSVGGIQCGQLITVFGCGGERDQAKRPVMGEIAARLSDRVIVTSDNPRSEDPGKIIQEILKGIPRDTKRGIVEVEPDRREAIGRALSLAQRGDIVLIAGKGHETYQQVGEQKLPFDDRTVAREWIASLTTPSK